MARLVSDNWPLNSYTNAEWTTLVGEPAVVTSILVSNTSADPLQIEMRMYDTVGSAALATILPSATLAAGAVATIDLRALTVKTGQALQVRADAQGANWFASGGA